MEISLTGRSVFFVRKVATYRRDCIQVYALMICDTPSQRDCIVLESTTRSDRHYSPTPCSDRRLKTTQIEIV